MKLMEDLHAQVGLDGAAPEFGDPSIRQGVFVAGLGVKGMDEDVGVQEQAGWIGVHDGLSSAVLRA